MQLKAKNVNLSSGGPLIVILNEEDARKLDLHALDRIKIKKHDKEIIAAIDISKKDFIKEGEIGFFIEVFEESKIKANEIVSVSIEPKPVSLQYIKKKLDGFPLSKMEINQIIKDTVDNKLTEIELGYFVSGCYRNGLTLYESAYLTEAIVANGGQLDLKKYPVLDKHSVGGIPGNRVTPIIVSIIAAAGFIIPKTSTRSITSAAGTSDVVEVFAPVAHAKHEIEKIVEKTNGCMVWGGALELASADDKLIKIERVLNLDPEGILLASILAKKAAVKATHVVIDIPIGKGTKTEHKKQAKRLKRKFQQLGKLLGIETKIIFTNGTQPIGNGIGPVLEARDVLLVLQNRGPEDLKNKALMIAGLLLEMVGVKNGYKKALQILETGQAYKKFKEIIRAQGGNPNIQPEKLKLGKYKYVVRADKSGVIKHIDNFLITKAAKVAGSPTDKAAGVYLNFHVNDKVKKDDILFTIYAENKKKLEYAINICNDFKIIILE